MTKTELAAQRLVDKLELIHKDEQYKSIWFLAANHGLNYTGPKYEKELKALKEALANAN